MKARREGKFTRGQSLPSRHFLQGFGPFRLVHVPQVRKRHPGRSRSVRVVLLLLQRLEAVPLRFLLLGLLFAGSSWEGSIHSKAFQFKNMRNSSSEVIGHSQKCGLLSAMGESLTFHESKISLRSQNLITLFRESHQDLRPWDTLAAITAVRDCKAFSKVRGNAGLENKWFVNIRKRCLLELRFLASRKNFLAVLSRIWEQSIFFYH